MVKEFRFRGKTMDELLAMDTEEFAKLLPARQRRSLIRRKDKKLEKRVEAVRKKMPAGVDMKPIRTHSRDAVITPKMVGLKFGIYNGREFKQIEIMKEMLGHYLGEFALTRVKLKHGKAGIGATKSSTAITARG